MAPLSTESESRPPLETPPQDELERLDVSNPHPIYVTTSLY